MSYCRFSGDNWKSDVYCYESKDGFELHVAGMRHSGNIPPLLEWGAVSTEQWFIRYHEQADAVSAAELVPIGGPHDGESFLYPTLDDLYNALLELRFDGYHVPDFALEAIKEEMAEETP